MTLPTLQELGVPYQNRMQWSSTCRFAGCNASYVRSCRQTLASMGVSKHTIAASCTACRGGDKIGVANMPGAQVPPSFQHAPYTGFYTEHLAPFRCKPQVRVLELGIWEGAALAVFSDYFVGEGALVFGADVNTEPYMLNRAAFEAKGAFRRNNVQVVRTDSTQECNQSGVSEALCPERVLAPFAPFDIIIDDGCHTTSCILSTFRNLHGLLGDGGAYFVEDNWSSRKQLQSEARGILEWVTGFTHDGLGGVYLLRPAHSRPRAGRGVRRKEQGMLG